MKTSRNVQSIYRNQNVLVRAVFERAGDAGKVICVALDLITDEATPLGFWRKVMLELHGIDLPQRP